MRLVRSDTFKHRFQEAPTDIQRRTEKTLRFLAVNLRHPSLRAKVFDETRRIWQARVTGSWRLYFQIQGDAYILLTLKKHS